MFELTNEQRICFGLVPVQDHWMRLELKPSPYHQHTSIAYLEDTTVRKFIKTGSNIYTEYEQDELLSEDLRYILPRTAKAKPILLSAATLEKRTPLGMGLSYSRNNRGYTDIMLFSHVSQRVYYSNCYEPMYTYGKDDFLQWVEQWCADTTPADLSDIAQFSVRPRKRMKFHEGDVFRFKINRRLYGYGRILIDYALMRKKNIPFWDILAGKPLACSVYHIATERTDVSIAELEKLGSLPSVHIMDNHFFYGDYEIIGSIPIGETEDYPIMYGDSIDARYRAVLLQCGKLFIRDDNSRALFPHMKNGLIGFDLRFELSVLLECIDAASNAPYWVQNKWDINQDLRNPQNREKLEQVCVQFGLSPTQLQK